nr:immunoglobulin light chain junction region [Macaca mulatta]MOW44292.1 immunoglobulin light chain junction region [Macaca mulatta]MOW45167.1 immunoglobulin light chain junction region [Macaca mulatta]
CQQGHNIPWTF